MKYLKEYNLTDKDLNELKKTLSKDMIENFRIMKRNVCEILDFLKAYGVNNLYNIIIFRPDICFRTTKSLEQSLTTLDKNLILYIIDKDVDDLINYNI